MLLVRASSLYTALLTICVVVASAQPEQHEPLYYSAEFQDYSGSLHTEAMNAVRQLNRSVFNSALYSRVREVWFGDLPWGARSNNQAATERWFNGPKDVKDRLDKQCHEEFGTAIDLLSPTKWPLTGLSDREITAPFVSEIDASGGGSEQDGSARTKTALSFLILLDQVPRNLYRTNETLSMVYLHYDRMALALARHIASTTPRLDLEPTIRLSQPYRQWFCLPLMHSEELEDHRLFGNILREFRDEAVAAGDKEAQDAVKLTIDFEDIHVKILERFGRYPHRHECLGREYTEEEREWLKEGGQRFGVAG